MWESPDAYQCLHETVFTVTCQKNNYDVFGLRKLYDQVESSVRNLKSLQMDTSGYGALLVPLLIEKLPFNTFATEVFSAIFPQDGRTFALCTPIP